MSKFNIEIYEATDTTCSGTPSVVENLDVSGCYSLNELIALDNDLGSYIQLLFGDPDNPFLESGLGLDDFSVAYYPNNNLFGFFLTKETCQVWQPVANNKQLYDNVASKLNELISSGADISNDQLLLLTPYYIVDPRYNSEFVSDNTLPLETPLDQCYPLKLSQNGNKNTIKNLKLVTLQDPDGTDSDGTDSGGTDSDGTDSNLSPGEIAGIVVGSVLSGMFLFYIYYKIYKLDRR